MQYSMTKSNKSKIGGLRPDTRASKDPILQKMSSASEEPYNKSTRLR